MKTDGVSLAFFSLYTKHQKWSQFGIIFRVFLYCTILHLKSYTFPPKTHTKRACWVRETATCWIFFLLRQCIGRQADSIRLYQTEAYNCCFEILADSQPFLFIIGAAFYISPNSQSGKASLNGPNQATHIEAFQPDLIDKCCNNLINTHNRRNKKVNTKTNWHVWKYFGVNKKENTLEYFCNINILMLHGFCVWLPKIYCTAQMERSLNPLWSYRI